MHFQFKVIELKIIQLNITQRHVFHLKSALIFNTIKTVLVIPNHMLPLRPIETFGNGPYFVLLEID